MEWGVGARKGSGECSIHAFQEEDTDWAEVGGKNFPIKSGQSLKSQDNPLFL